MTSSSFFREIAQSTTDRLRVVLAGPVFKSQEVLVNLLMQKDLEPIFSSSLEETKFLLTQEDTTLVICHADSQDGVFRDLLRTTARKGSKVPVILCADFYDPHLYLEAMELGAFDYFVYPYYRDGVEWVIGNALQNVSNHRRGCQGAQKATYEAASC